MLLHKNIFHVIIFLIIVAIPILLSAQTKSLPQLSEKAYVSVVTCSPTPGYEGGFGHSALRIQDASLKIDVILTLVPIQKTNHSLLTEYFKEHSYLIWTENLSKSLPTDIKKKEEG